MRIVLDTNVWISASFWKGDSDKIVESIDSKQLICFISQELLFEYEEVIIRPEILEKIEDKKLILSDTVKKAMYDAILVEPKEKLNIVKDDPSDNIVLECANAGKVDYIITNDNHLLKLKQFKKIKIITPKEFLKIKLTL